MTEMQNKPPPYGSLSPAEEFDLLRTDRAAWIAYVAERAGQRVLAGGPESIRFAWSVMDVDYKRAVWRRLDAQQRETIRAALGEVTQP